MIRGVETGAGRLAVLAEETRRRVYTLVRSRPRGITRDDAAASLGISRKLSAFHLEKLLKAGLVKASYARPAGRTGRGAGRTAKYYSPADVEIEVSLPERRYDLVGSLLVDAVLTASADESPADAALRVANERGFQRGAEIRTQRSLGRVGPERALSVAEEALRDEGFEPYRDEPAVVSLRNCPFHRLAQHAPDLVCAMNRSYLDGLLRGMGNRSVDAVLACKPGDCCVTLRGPKA